MNFYTSSSKFLAILGFFFAVYLSFSIWTNYYVLIKGLSKDNERLLYVQLDKISKQRDVEIAFVGDSSLGNAIDARLVEKITNKKTINAALTGSYGYSGSYNLARRIYDQNRESLKYLVIMQTLDVASRDVSADLYRKTECLSCGDSLSVLLSSLLDKQFMVSYLGSWIDAFVNKNYIQARLNRINPPKVKKKGDTEGDMNYDPRVDYYAQNPPQGVNDAEIPKLSVPKINPQSEIYLRYLSAFCEEKKITCIYLHGPIYEGLGRRYAGYKSVLDDMVAKNFKGGVSGGPYMMKSNEVGDSLDHVFPAYKEKTTRFYLDKMNID